jgi:mannose-6-phosphate isomerase-like protein (cupin superfamily)
MFQSGGAPPAWCQLKGFELLALDGAGRAHLRRTAQRERVLVTASAIQLSCNGRSQVLSEKQFFDLPDHIDDYWLVAVRPGAQVVRLIGDWGAELGGCGIFTARNDDNSRDSGDPVDYPKYTSVDSHYHDCDEYWIGLEGWGEAIVGNRRIRFGAGDCVPIRAGHRHDLPNSPDGTRAVFFETTLIGEKRVGHLWEHTHGPAVPQPE